MEGGAGGGWAMLLLAFETTRRNLIVLRRGGNGVAAMAMGKDAPTMAMTTGNNAGARMVANDGAGATGRARTTKHMPPLRD